MAIQWFGYTMNLALGLQWCLVVENNGKNTEVLLGESTVRFRANMTARFASSGDTEVREDTNSISPGSTFVESRSKQIESKYSWKKSQNKLLP